MLQWKLLDEIEPGTRVVISRHVEFDRGSRPRTSSTPAFLAGAMVAEGLDVTETTSASTTPTSVFFDAVVGGISTRSWAARAT